jgi:hypothetical protein
MSDLVSPPGSLEDLAELRKREWAAQVAQHPVLARGLADSRDRVGWSKARSGTMGASDVAKFSKVESVPLYVKGKLFSPFSGNDFTSHGNDREPVILAAFSFEQNFTLFHSADNVRHTATPDGLKWGGNGSLLLAEAKTTAKEFRTIPLAYRRQVWWAQYVMGTDRTLFMWEVHDGFNPVRMEPDSIIIERDDAAVENMIIIADLVLAGMDAGAEFEAEMLEKVAMK